VFHRTLYPDLSDERLNPFEQQKKFMWLHGFIARDVGFAQCASAPPERV
jgi:hypothetical protein